MDSYLISNQESENIYEKFSAIKKTIGFDYQFYLFLLELLDIKENEEIGLEVKDDVHISRENKLILIQTKHSLSGKSISDCDSDLWKTLANWTQIIKVKGSIDDQIDFVSNTQFHLVSNRKISKKSIFCSTLNSLQLNEIKIELFLEQVNNISTSQITIKRNISTVLTLDRKVLYEFLLKISIKSEVDDILKKIKKKIKEKYVQEYRINDVFNSLESSIRHDFFKSVKEGFSCKVSYDEFHTKYSRCFESGRIKKLPIRNCKIKLPNNLEDQTFIKQLMDIEDITSNNKDDMIKFTTCKFHCFNNLKEWLNNGELTIDEVNAFHENSIDIWDIIYRQNFGGLAKPTLTENVEDKKKGRVIVNSLREKDLVLVDTQLSRKISNGHFYWLADIPKIGFLPKWMNKHDK